MIIGYSNTGQQINDQNFIPWNNVKIEPGPAKVIKKQLIGRIEIDSSLENLVYPCLKITINQENGSQYTYYDSFRPFQPDKTKKIILAFVRGKKTTYYQTKLEKKD